MYHLSNESTKIKSNKGDHIICYFWNILKWPTYIKGGITLHSN